MYQVGTEDFRVMTESVGIQLDDDSLLALFRRVSSLPCMLFLSGLLDVGCNAQASLKKPAQVTPGSKEARILTWPDLEKGSPGTAV